ncbi:CYTH domain-containing protein [Paludibacteraceae bacterium OttesenSCG-928-F17]|nr:CYTH domain-containing protein [Paludibacteraceae bacterium OttesenSCG-928-F17]
MLEIERKFLVKNDSYKTESIRSYPIMQGYLSFAPERTVRIRIKANKGYITVKGKSNKSQMTRFEWEKRIPLADARNLLALCEPVIIQKTRYEIPCGNYMYEVDEFHGDHEGLVIAEIELKSEEDSFFKPTWLGEEVTTDKKYYNSYLSKHPFK